MRLAQVVWLTGAVLLSSVVTGCTSSPPAPAQSPDPRVAANVEACDQLVDAETLVANLSEAEDAGRLIAGEWTGVTQLVARMVQRMQPEAGTPLADSTAALQAVTPQEAVASGFDPRHDTEWIAAYQAVSEDCADVYGFEFGTYGWIGG